MDRKRSALTVVSLAAFALLAAATDKTSDSTSSSSSSSSSTPAAPPPPMPADQAAFCQAVRSSASSYEAMEGQGANQFKLSKLRSARAADLKSALTSRNVKDWVGQIGSLSTNGDGNGVLAIKMPCDAEVKTWNNSLSDIEDSTLIGKNSPIYDTLSELKEGISVRFSGRFFSDPANGFKESSVTEQGSMKEPEFIMKFAAVSKL